MDINDYFNQSGESYLTLLTPGLARSEETYFGKEAPLAQDLIKYSTELKEYIGTDNNKFKDKKFQNKLLVILDRFGKAVAKDINAERCQFVIIFDRYDINAAAYGMQYKSDLVIDKDNFRGIDLDKVADLEDIVVTSEGYKYRNPKGKLLAITINHVTFQKLEPLEIAAVIAHEIGHNFQNGIFGAYKATADMYLCTKIENIQSRLSISSNAPRLIKWIFNHSLVLKIFHFLLSYLVHPKLLSEGVFAKLGRFIYKKMFGKVMNENTFLMKEQLRKMDNDEEDTIHTSGTKTITNTLSYTNGTTGTRNEFLKNNKQMELDQFDNLQEADEDLNDVEEIKTSRNFIVNFFKSVSKDIQLLQDNILHFLLLSDYTVNTYEKISFRKKYEYFADIFATSYGFSPNLYKFLNIGFKDVDDYEKSYEVGINKIPFVRALYKTQMYLYIRRESIHDTHGTNQQRLSNMYTDLMHELNTNQDLTSKQKTEIMNEINNLKKADEVYYNEKKRKGFWFKYYNKLIDNRLKGMNPDTEKYILGPVDDICKEEI